MSARTDGRLPEQLRPLVLLPNYTKHAEGSVLIECGDTRVICTASVEEKVPHFLRGTSQGWVTSEYGMIPRSTGIRMVRESAKGKPSGRTQEIQRLIGRSLRCVVDLKSLGERTVWIDCDVIQADGGTRTASITGAFVALALALARIRGQGTLTEAPLLDFVAAVSVGVVNDAPLLDLNYDEDSKAEVDMNVVMTGADLFVEVQGTAEGRPFSAGHLDTLLKMAHHGIIELIDQQRSLLEAELGDLSFLFQRDFSANLSAPAGNAKRG